MILIPHSMAVVPDLNEALASLFRENLKRYLDGEPLTNELDKQRLYGAVRFAKGGGMGYLPEIIVGRDETQSTGAPPGSSAEVPRWRGPARSVGRISCKT